MKKSDAIKKGLIPAIPPEDYKGSIAEWMVSLQEKGLWNGRNPDWYGDVYIPEKTYLEILEECES